MPVAGAQEGRQGGPHDPLAVPPAHPVGRAPQAREVAEGWGSLKNKIQNIVFRVVLHEQEASGWKCQEVRALRFFLVDIV